jgi:hypothetical protein
MPLKKKPSPAQLAARAKFVAMVRAKSKAKKSATKKATVKKAAPKKAAPKKAAKKKLATKKASTHKDTKSHNVNIRVVSGVNPLSEILSSQRFIVSAQKKLNGNLNYIKTHKPSQYEKNTIKLENSWLRSKINFYKKFISTAKKHIK